jgi:hypothetical protein
MAIKVSGTEVIDNDRKLVNIADMQGNYGAFRPINATATNNIGFENPVMNCVLSADTTFTESGTGTSGKPTCTLLLDTTTSAHTPTFSSAINWENNTEPTWSTYRKWQITFHEITDSPLRIDAAAVGFSAQNAQPSEAVTLDGTTSSPERLRDDPGIAPFIAGWRFKSDGNVYKYESPNNVSGNGEYLFSTTTWNNITPSQTYYIRVTNYSGTNLDVTESDSLNTWLSLDQTRTFEYKDTRAVNSYADTDGVFKAEISSTSNGSNIVATGYYQVYWIGTA